MGLLGISGAQAADLPNALGVRDLDQKFSGIATFGPTAPKPATVYEFKDQDTVSLNVRVQRNF